MSLLEILAVAASVSLATLAVVATEMVARLKPEELEEMMKSLVRTLGAEILKLGRIWLSGWRSLRHLSCSCPSSSLAPSAGWGRRCSVAGTWRAGTCCRPRIWTTLR